MATVIKLKKPIDAHGEQVSELELRDITGGDVIDLGQPMNVNADESFNFRMDVVARYVSRLAAIPMSSVREMSPGDLTNCAAEIAGFFGE
jgi:hypothetical protein